MGSESTFFLLSLRHSALIAFAAVFFLLWSPWAAAQGDNFSHSTYTVVAGDTLSSIAVRHSTTVSELRRLNGLSSELLAIGQMLNLPGRAANEPLPEGFRNHAVASGETLEEIAGRYGVDRRAIEAVNQGVLKGGVAPGEALRIPPEGGRVKVVQEGSSLLAVVLEHGLSPAYVAQVNGVRSLSRLESGRVVYLPPATVKGPAPANAVPAGRRDAHRELQRTLLARAGELLGRFEPRPQGYAWPLAKPGRISSYFGFRNISVGGNTFHAGLDIAAPLGTQVLASRDGVVSRTGWIGAYGYSVFVDHGDATQTRYAHLSMVSVQVGELIAQGEAVGRVGSTGASTGPHLHFELRFQGRAVNPLDYLVRYGASAD